MKTIRTISWCALFGMFAAVAGASDAPAGGAGEADSTAAAAAATRVPGPTLSEIRERAGRMPIDARNDIDKRIGVTVERVDKESGAKGQNVLAARLAREFRMTKEGLLDEKGEHGFSWGDLVIAHTLLANSSAGVTLTDLANLRSEGLSWGAIAFGLGFHMEDLEDAIKAQGRVAMGFSKTDLKAPATSK